MTWFRSSVAIAAMVAVASAPLAGLAQVAAPQETLADIVGRDQAEVAALPADQQLDAEELDTLVAPVALYPDALLAQVLVASTYPLQIAQADRLLDETEGLSDDEVAQRIAEQDWDPSVMVLLSGFPTVVQRMADDLDWTERLGSAMVGQDEEVLAAVQRKRTEALDTGWLMSNDAQVVERRDDVVTIRPANPDVVYVPSYDASRAFTSAPTAQPYIAPSSNPLANPLVAGAVAFGAALLVQQLFNDDDDHDDDSGWNDYWHRSEPFDWQDRQFYPRPDRGWHRGHDEYAWSRERDDHWDRGRRGWSYDAPARAARDRERRAAVAWTARPVHEGMSRIGDLRAVARERPPHPPLGKPRPAAARPPARVADKPPARAAVERPVPPKPGVRQPPPRAGKLDPAAKPGAAARPKPKPAPKPAAEARRKPEAKPAPKPVAEAKRKPAPKPVAEAKRKPEVKAAPKPIAEAKRKPEAKAAPKPAAKPKPKPAARATPKPAAAAAKQPPKKAVQAKPKPAAKAKPKPKPAAQAKPKPKPAQQQKPPAKKKAACKPGDDRCRQQNR